MIQSTTVITTSFLLFLLVLQLGKPHHAVVVATTTPATCGRDPTGGVVTIRNDWAIAVCSDRIVRVVRGKDAVSIMAQRESLVIDPDFSSAAATPEFEVETTTIEGNDSILWSIKTQDMWIRIDENQNSLSFWDSSGSYLFTKEEEELFTTAESSEVNDNNNQSPPVAVRQGWTLSPGESIYGGGQFVNGLLDYRAAPVHLVQYNTEAVVPFFVSSRGYGLLWDNYGETWLNPPPPNHKNQSHHYFVFSSPSSNTTTTTQTLSGDFTPPFSGDYWFALDLRGGDYFEDLVTDVRLVLLQGKGNTNTTIIACEHVSLANIPKVVTCKVNGLDHSTKYKTLLEYNSKVVPSVFYRHLNSYNYTTIQSKDTEMMDYYFMVGDTSQQQDSNIKDHFITTTKLDSVMASYRLLTGPARLMSKKAYGFWQCKEHYHNQSELLESARQFRLRKIPVDYIVQDWRYWGSLGWGPQWDTTIYPDPEGMIQELHDDLNLSLMVSVWSKFEKKTKFYKEMNDKRGYLINGTIWHDPWNPEARKLFYKYLNDALFSIGADAVWLDATEPEEDVHLNKTIHLGSGNEYRNTYSLEVAKSFFEGFMADYGIKMRPFALTRSSFAGQQRFASVVWSGDVTGSFESLRRQIAMAINYQLSGIPYWACDIGGFFRPKDQYTSKEYHLLLIRWFQFGAFVPIMRVHGAGSDTELWNYGNETQSVIVRSAIDLRYRLMPYIYSGFRRVEQEGYTMGPRAMVFDFPGDYLARNLSDQFMFGESFLVAPLYNLDSSRTFYLPSLSADSVGGGGGMWRDFYKGTVVKGGRHYNATHVDMASMLLFIRSSIVVLAPRAQHVHDDDAMVSLEVRIYVGKDSSFVLFEDDGVDNDPNRPFSTISFEWSETTSQLHIGKRQGDGYPGMPLLRTIHVVLVRSGQGVGVDETDFPDATVTYDGRELNLDMTKAHKEVLANDAQLPDAEDRTL